VSTNRRTAGASDGFKDGYRQALFVVADYGKLDSANITSLAHMIRLAAQRHGNKYGMMLVAKLLDILAREVKNNLSDTISAHEALIRQMQQLAATFMEMEEWARHRGDHELEDYVTLGFSEAERVAERLKKVNDHLTRKYPELYGDPAAE